MHVGLLRYLEHRGEIEIVDKGLGPENVANLLERLELACGALWADLSPVLHARPIPAKRKTTPCSPAPHDRGERRMVTFARSVEALYERCLPWYAQFMRRFDRWQKAERLAGRWMEERDDMRWREIIDWQLQHLRSMEEDERDFPGLYPPPESEYRRARGSNAKRGTMERRRTW